MKKMITLALFLLPFFAFSQVNKKPKPAYCNEPAQMYDQRSGAGVGKKKKPSLPKFTTTPVTEYKIQVAILRTSSPEDYPFHKSLIARWQPCEEVWIVESKQSFTSRKEAENLRTQLDKLGYDGAYIVELVGYN